MGLKESQTVKQYNPEDYLDVNLPYRSRYGVIILNRPIELTVKYVVPFWNNATIRVTVDGGTNRWCNYIEDNKLNSKDIASIDIICGDFDSIKKERLQQFKQDPRVRVQHTPEQDENDFTKSVRLLHSYCDNNNIALDAIVVFCQSSGRMDQILANLDTLFKFKVKRWLEPATLYIMSNDSLTWLLDKGTSAINVPNMSQLRKNAWCALVPVGSKAKVTSKGLSFDLDNTVCEFGGILSTSNEFASVPTVTVTTNAPLLWSMGLIPIMSKLYGTKDEEE